MEQLIKILKVKDLGSNEKLLMVLFLSEKQFLLETNKQIGETIGLTSVTVSHCIKSLVEKDYIKVLYHNNGIKRLLYFGHSTTDLT